MREHIVILYTFSKDDFLVLVIVAQLVASLYSPTERSSSTTQHHVPSWRSSYSHGIVSTIISERKQDWTDSRLSPACRYADSRREIPSWDKS
ncbi:hypothetical protein LX36DRAFT_389474 [Colletotrichum falcatum]|nr:hypothetical protein LX36DRAFT_389474 [Colletotrichum falcatum]